MVCISFHGSTRPLERNDSETATATVAATTSTLTSFATTFMTFTDTATVETPENRPIDAVRNVAAFRAQAAAAALAIVSSFCAPTAQMIVRKRRLRILIWKCSSHALSRGCGERLRR